MGAAGGGYAGEGTRGRVEAGEGCGQMAEGARQRAEQRGGKPGACTCRLQLLLAPSITVWPVAGGSLWSGLLGLRFTQATRNQNTTPNWCDTLVPAGLTCGRRLAVRPCGRPAACSSCCSAAGVSTCGRAAAAGWAHVGSKKDDSDGMHARLWAERRPLQPAKRQSQGGRARPYLQQHQNRHGLGLGFRGSRLSLLGGSLGMCGNPPHTSPAAPRPCCRSAARTWATRAATSSSWRAGPCSAGNEPHHEEGAKGRGGGGWESAPANACPCQVCDGDGWPTDRPTGAAGRLQQCARVRCDGALCYGHAPTGQCLWAPYPALPEAAPAGTPWTRSRQERAAPAAPSSAPGTRRCRCRCCCRA